MGRLHVKLLPLGLFVFMLITIGTLFYNIFEGWRMLDALYFTVMTLTTVGYGDFRPTSDPSKIFTIVYVLGGVYMMIYTLRVFTTHYIEKKSKKVQKAVTQTLEHMAERKKKSGDMVFKVKAEEQKDLQQKN